MKLTVIAAVALTLVGAPNAFASRFHVRHHARAGWHHLRVKMHHGHRHLHNMVYHGHM